MPRAATPNDVGGPTSVAVERSSIALVRSFIADSWSQTVRTNFESHDDLIGLPRPYTVPTTTGAFQEMYYWDTYFTNEGLILDGHLGQAIDNAENLAHLVTRSGKVLNGNRTWFENRSQPPFLAMIVERLHRALSDLDWLRRHARILEREYRFWTTNRLTPCGLSRYSSEGTQADKLEMVNTVGDRLGSGFRNIAARLSRPDLATLGSHLLAEAESGWDFTPRFDGRCEDFCPVDLNANLHRYETVLARFWTELGDHARADLWRRRARGRRALLRRFCRDPITGQYHDYDFVHDRRSAVLSAAVFSLLYARAVSEPDAGLIAHGALAGLEFAHGIAACADEPSPHRFQWSYPNSWAPLNFLACVGLANYGREHDSLRIARKYVSTVIGNFARTGNLWEKYNAADGSIDVHDEYEMPAMLGWSAGVFVWASELISEYDRTNLS